MFLLDCVVEFWFNVGSVLKLLLCVSIRMRSGYHCFGRSAGRLVSHRSVGLVSNRICIRAFGFHRWNHRHVSDCLHSWSFCHGAS